MTALLIVLAVLAILGAAAGVFAALRAGGPGDRARRATGSERGLVRITAAVHTGWEQTLVGLVRELGLPREATDLRYGQLYLDVQDEHRSLVRSRSEIGRGFLGAIDLTPGTSITRFTYGILRLPGDEDLNSLVLDLELRIVAALRRIDPGVELQLSADALRNLDGFGRAPRPQTDPSFGKEPE
ncbi:MAG: hypothetical protein ACTHJL_14425 [Amnibacterium sp.]